jgi:hypothetical protein
MAYTYEVIFIRFESASISREMRGRNWPIHYREEELTATLEKICSSKHIPAALPFLFRYSISMEPLV